MILDEKVFIKKNFMIVLALVYSVTITVMTRITKDSRILDINFYVSVIISFFVSYKVMSIAIRSHNKGIMLYIALGICCLALGNLYFFLLRIVSIVPGDTSVGLFTKICSYLFFISALLEHKKKTGEKGTLYFTLINIITFILTVACAYAVLANDIPVLNSSVLLMDFFCIVLSFGLLSNKNAQFLAFLIITVALLDIISAVQIFAFIWILIKTLSPLLYLLFAKLIYIMKEGDTHAY